MSLVCFSKLDVSYKVIVFWLPTCIKWKSLHRKTTFAESYKRATTRLVFLLPSLERDYFQADLRTIVSALFCQKSIHRPWARPSRNILIVIGNCNPIMQMAHNKTTTRWTSRNHDIITHLIAGAHSWGNNGLVSSRSRLPEYHHESGNERGFFIDYSHVFPSWNLLSGIQTEGYRNWLHNNAMVFVLCEQDHLIKKLFNKAIHRLNFILTC